MKQILTNLSIHVEKPFRTNYQHLVWGLDFSLSLPLSLLSYFLFFTRKKIDDLFGFSSLRNFRPRKFKSVRSFIATLKDEAISVLSFLASINGRDEKFANFPATTFFSLRESGLFLVPPCNRTSSKSLGARRGWGRRMRTIFFNFFFRFEADLSYEK